MWKECVDYDSDVMMEKMPRAFLAQILYVESNAVPIRGFWR